MTYHRAPHPEELVAGLREEYEQELDEKQEIIDQLTARNDRLAAEIEDLRVRLENSDSGDPEEVGQWVRVFNRVRKQRNKLISRVQADNELRSLVARTLPELENAALAFYGLVVDLQREVAYGQIRQRSAQ